MLLTILDCKSDNQTITSFLIICNYCCCHWFFSIDRTVLSLSLSVRFDRIFENGSRDCLNAALLRNRGKLAATVVMRSVI